MIGLDSTFIIDFLRGDKNAVELVSKHNDQYAITPINIYEVYLGFFLNVKSRSSCLEQNVVEKKRGSKENFWAGSGL